MTFKLFTSNSPFFMLDPKFSREKPIFFRFTPRLFALFDVKSGPSPLNPRGQTHLRWCRGPLRWPSGRQQARTVTGGTGLKWRWGYLLHSHGKIHPFFIGKPSINGPFSMVMLNNQMVVGISSSHSIHISGDIVS